MVMSIRREEAGPSVKGVVPWVGDGFEDKKGCTEHIISDFGSVRYCFVELLPGRPVRRSGFT